MFITICNCGLLFMLLISQTAFSQQKPDAILGVWETPGDDNGRVEIFKTGNAYHGKIIWLQKPIENGKPRTDENNPDANLKNQPIIGLHFLKDFVFDGEDEWNSGTVYDPDNGKTYKCYLQLENPDKLKVRGYVGISLLGRTEYWTRVN